MLNKFLKKVDNLIDDFMFDNDIVGGLFFWSFLSLVVMIYIIKIGYKDISSNLELIGFWLIVGIFVLVEIVGLTILELWSMKYNCSSKKEFFLANIFQTLLGVPFLSMVTIFLIGICLLIYGIALLLIKNIAIVLVTLSVVLIIIGFKTLLFNIGNKYMREK